MSSGWTRSRSNNHQQIVFHQLNEPMINDAVDFIRRELCAHLGLTDSQVTVGPAANKVDPDAHAGVRIALVNIQEDAFRGGRQVAKRRGDGLAPIDSPRRINIDLLFAFDFHDYAANLRHLSSTIEFFQHKPVLAPSTDDPGAVPFPASIETLTLEIVNMQREELHHLWTTIGAAYRPSVMYRAQLIRRQPRAATAPEFTTLQLDAALQ